MSQATTCLGSTYDGCRLTKKLSSLCQQMNIFGATGNHRFWTHFLEDSSFQLRTCTANLVHYTYLAFREPLRVYSHSPESRSLNAIFPNTFFMIKLKKQLN